MKKALLFFILFLSQTFYSQSDCVDALSVCGNSNISYTPDGFGTQELPESNCGSYEERYSVWYKFTVATAGTLTFAITPNSPSDYDWYVWGPNITCANKGNTIRCSTPGGSGPTGLNMTSTDPYDYFGQPGSNADGWAKYLDVLPGETYYLLINNYSINIAGFSMIWGGTATLASPFNDPALTPNPFIPPGVPNATPTDPNEVIICTDPAVFDFSSLTSGIVNGNSNFIVSYHYSQNEALSGNNAITTPQTVNTTTTYFYSIRYEDPINPNNPMNSCREIGKFKFKQGNIQGKDATLTMCNNNNANTALFDLTTANVFDDPAWTVVKKYYPSMQDLNAGTNEITNPYAYLSSTNVIYVSLTTPQGCSDIAKINLELYAPVQVKDFELKACFIETNPSTGLFDLDKAVVTTPGTGIVTKRYFPSLTDAIDATNEILNATNYIAPNGVVYVRVSDNRQCYTIAKITLKVLPPVKSNVLADKIICMEDKTTLDAGPGFTGYEWSTGATTQSIRDVGVGSYWVKLKTGDCVTLQNVKVYASEQPVITNVDISNNTLNVNVIGGTPEYQYSMDNILWQTSSTFNNVARGTHKVYVKDSYDCEPIVISVLVPNLINLITPNGDGINDAIDYSAMADKQDLVLSIYDRYGVKIHQADKSNGYKWDGTIAGKKIPTGTYWYSLTWNENNKKNTAFKFSGWIAVKNRE